MIFSDQSNLDELVEDFNVFKRDAKDYDNNEKIYWDYNSQILPFAQKHNALISIHAGRKSNGVDEKISNSLPHNQAVKSEYATTISIFEMGQVRDIDEYNEKVIPNIGAKPMIICSDNHDARNYDPANKLWIKADVTFNGLKQIIYEPDERVRISDTKPECKLMVPSARIMEVMRYLSARSKPWTVSSAISCTEEGARTIMWKSP